MKNEQTSKPVPQIAILDNNTLSAIGLRMLLERIIPVAEVRIFSIFQELVDDTPDMYFHYFISAQNYLEHNAFFLPRKHKTMVMVNGSNTLPQLAGAHTLNINQSEDSLVKDILRMQQHGHRSHGISPIPQEKKDASTLSAREIEVLTLLTKGLINKEIASRLNISLTTVITHRKNMVEKLGIKSVSGLTIYAVMNGYVDADAI